MEAVMEKVEVQTTEFSVDCEELLTALMVCSKIVPQTSNIPVLTMLKFELEENELHLTANDGSSQCVRTKLAVNNESKTDAPVGFLVPSKECLALIKKIPRGEVRWKIDENGVNIAYGRKKSGFTLNTVDAEEYPDVPQMEAKDFFTIDLDTLKKGANACKFCSLKEGVLSGIYLNQVDGNLAFVSCDRHRLYRFISEIEFPECSATIPGVHFKSIVDSLSKESDTVEMAITETYLVLKDKQVTYYGKLLGGKYPDISGTVVYHENKAVVPRQLLHDILNRMAILNKSFVSYAVKDEGLSVSAKGDAGQAEEWVDTKKHSGEPIDINLNCNYVKDALSVSGAEYVEVQYGGRNDPVVFVVEGDRQLYTLVLPIR